MKLIKTTAKVFYLALVFLHTSCLKGQKRILRSSSKVTAAFAYLID